MSARTGCFLVLVTHVVGGANAALTLSAGFSDGAVLQRSSDRGVKVFGFTDTDGPVSVTVADDSATSGGQAAHTYTVAAVVALWVPSGCGAPGDTKTPCPAPPHGNFTWHAQLRPQAAAGKSFTITAQQIGVSGPNTTISIHDVTFGDVWFCSGQSNMQLPILYSFSADMLKAELASGKYANLRHFTMAGIGGHIEATAPQWVTTQNSLSAGAEFTWHRASVSSAEPSINATTNKHSAWADFSGACMYFGAALTDEMARRGLGNDVPIGLIQSAIGGSQIESWMSNETLLECKNLSLTGGAVPQDSGRLYYGMVAPFANYSVRGWTWYQGENNCYGVTGNSAEGTGYGCALPAMIRNWRDIWGADASDNALFGVATLAAGGSEGSGWNMAGLRWSQTGNYGVWPNPAMPNSFGAHVYDISDPWANVGDGNRRNPNASANGGLACCFPEGGACPTPPSQKGPHYTPCPDTFNCSLPEPATGAYGADCAKWDPSTWEPALRPLAPVVRDNSPSGVPGLNFMGGIHPRLKRPVGQRLAYAAAQQMVRQSLESRRAAGTEPGGGAGVGVVGVSGAVSGPTISGCTLSQGGDLVVHFNASLLGGDALELRDYNSISNASDWAPAPGWSGIKQLHDSSALMVCAVNESDPHSGNASTCACSHWNYFQYNSTTNDCGFQPCAFWYCETGPGWKPRTETIDRELRRRREELRVLQDARGRDGGAGGSSGRNGRVNRLGWVAQANKFQMQWQPARFLPAPDGASARVDLAHLGGRTPVAVRLAWPLFDAPDQPSDTCCPGSAAQTGKSACIPGNCPLYTTPSGLPANPFFALVTAEGKCQCPSPQVCAQ